MAPKTDIPPGCPKLLESGERTFPRTLRDGGIDPDGVDRAGDAAALLELRPVGDPVAGLARRARRPPAGAAAHPVHDVLPPAPDLRRPPGQVRENHRGGHGQLP